MSDSFSRRRALTYVTCAVVIALALPAGAFAVVAGSNVFVTDPSTGHRAHVNSSGQLSVSDTGSTVKVGNTVPVTGTVRTLAFPAKPYSIFCSPSTSTTYAVECLKAIPAGETFVVQSLSGMCERSTAAPVRLDVQGSDAAGHPVYMGLVPGPDGGYSNSWWDTNAQLTGTEYFTGTLEMDCIGTSSPGYRLLLDATAEGYLYP